MRKEIESIFGRLNKKVEYVYFRDKKYLNSILNGAKDDIDIVIRPKDLEKFNKIMLDHDYITFHKISKRRRQIVYINWKNPSFPPFDVQINDIYKLRYIGGSEFLSNRQLKEGIYIPGPKQKLVLLVFKDLFLHGFYGSKEISKTKKGEIKALWENKENREYFAEKAEKVLGKSCKELSYLVEKQKFRRIWGKRSKWRIAALRKNPLFMRHIIHNAFYYIFLSKLAKGSKVISIMGIDGSGKTTLAESIDKILKNAGMKSKVIYLGRWIPVKIITKAGRVTTKIISGKKGASAKILSRIKFFARDTLYILKYYLALFSRIIPGRFANHFLITDRYIYDLKTQSKWFRPYNLFVNFLYPKPSISMFLYNDAEIIHKRKMEQSVEQLKNDQKILMAEADKIRAAKIKSDTKEKTLEKALRCILSKKNPKYYTQ